MTGKSLTFKNSSDTNQERTKKNICENTTFTNANIGSLITNTINTECIMAITGKMANIIYQFDPKTNITSIQKLSDNLIIKSSDDSESVEITKNNDVSVKNNLEIGKNINAKNGNFNGDLTANDINLLGDITSTNSHITNEIIIDKKIISNEAHIHGNIEIDGTLISNNNIVTPSLIVNDNLKTDTLETFRIKSPLDLVLEPGINQTINIPNIQYNIDIRNLQLIDPIAIKSSKIFIVSRNIILEPDESCDGIEIIIYNKNFSGIIIIRDIINIIYELPAQCTVKLIFIFVIGKWIIV